MYPSLIWFLLLLVSVPMAYVMRRRSWYVLAWFVALAVVGWLLPPFEHHVYCDAVASKCVEYAVPDPYSFLEKTLSTLMFIVALVVGFYMALKEGVFGRRLW
jgi:hypothetical protein